MIDVFIAKKYPYYFTEYNDDKRSISRCQQTAERLSEAKVNLRPVFKFLLSDTLKPEKQALLTVFG